MRTQIRLLATSAITLGLTAAAAFGGPTATAGPPLALALDVPETRLVLMGSTPSAGGQMVHYVVYQRAQARLARGPERDVVMSATDAELVCEQLEKDGWLQICTLAIVESGAVTHAPVTAAPAASSSPGESAAPLALAIAPLRANPASGRSLVVDVALPGAGPARLEMLDVMGRVVSERDLGSLGAGRHSVDLSAERRYAPGVYLLRLTRAGESKVARVTVLD